MEELAEDMSSVPKIGDRILGNSALAAQVVTVAAISVKRNQHVPNSYY
jgi:hypothetical protein